MTISLFISKDDLVSLTGRRMKSAQIAWLRSSGIPFRVSATGHPVVTRAAVEGIPTPTTTQHQARWTPRAAGA